MSASTTTTESTLDERRSAHREFEAAAAQARQLEEAIASQRKDVTRLEKRRDAFAKIGNGHVESAFRTYDERYRCSIEWEPMRSKLTGNELAAGVEVQLAHLRSEIGKAEAEIEQLLAQ